MQEPSVLDYLKAIFKNWGAFQNFLKARSERTDTAQLVEVEMPVAGPREAVKRAPLLDLRRLPSRTLLVLLLSLLAQKTFEPPQDGYYVGIILYMAALGLALWAFRRGEWALTLPPPDETRVDSFRVRRVAFFLSIILGGATFYMMTGNLFTTVNLSLWAGTIFLHLWAFWVRESRPIKWPSWNLKGFLMRDEWTIRFKPFEWSIRITRWGLLVFLVVAASVFFRTYRLATVAPEMTSDHAEKLMDVYDITQGVYSIYFPRNTGREPLYIYLSALVSQWFGLSFLTLKIVAVIAGLLTLPYIYLLGREFGGPRIGLLAAAFAGFGYWPTVIERFGLRISFYPFFAAATLYYFVRGLRRQHRNDFILAGVALGLGLNGYTPFRIMPFALVALFIVYLLHQHDEQTRKRMLVWFGLLAFTSWIFFIPLARFATERPDLFTMRAFSRLGTLERPFPAPVWQLLLLNLWTALKQFNWYNGNIWVHSVPGRPALDVVSGALFLIGVTLVLVRYIRNRHWKDLLILLAVPLLQLPSILSLAYPEENPALNRTAGALVPVFLLVGFGLDGLLNSFAAKKAAGEATHENAGVVGRRTPAFPFLNVMVVLGLFTSAFLQNYDLIFNQYYNGYLGSAWNTSEMGSVIKGFMDDGGSADNVWMVPYAFWVDTRLPAFAAGLPGRDLAIAPERLGETVPTSGAKLFLFFVQDEPTRQALEQFYPNGKLTVLKSVVESHDFYVFRIPASK